jgi:hypothetical protein
LASMSRSVLMPMTGLRRVAGQDTGHSAEGLVLQGGADAECSRV